MYALTFKLYQPSWLNTAIYNHLAETYRLPSIESLIVGLDHDVEWQCDPSTQLYYIENLREVNTRHVFQVRFKTRQGAHDYTSVFLSIDTEKQQVHLLTVQFPARGDRHCSSHILGWMKDAAKKDKIDPEFELEGYGERDTFRFIREHSLSAFQWVESLNRYLHVTDHLREVKEIKKGL